MGFEWSCSKGKQPSRHLWIGKKLSPGYLSQDIAVADMSKAANPVGLASPVMDIHVMIVMVMTDEA